LAFLESIWLKLSENAEFWSGTAAAILGAFVGGAITFFVQWMSLREAQRIRENDRRQIQEALGNSLFFKLIKINSNFVGLHEYVETCFKNADERKLGGEPWMFVEPLANPHDRIHFTSEEMGMLLSLKNNNVFNCLLRMDDIHNSLLGILEVFNKERDILTERLNADSFKDSMLKGVLDQNQILQLKPNMIRVNSLIDSMRREAKRDVDESESALDALYELLHSKLGIKYKLEKKKLIE
jgi:hypothetical protein